jgi:hypothetical protein
LDLPLEAFAFLALGLFAFPEDDKRMHFLAGAATAETARRVGFTPLQTCDATLALGIAKEAWDATGRGQVEAKDAIATAAGCGVTIRF